MSLPAAFPSTSMPVVDQNGNITSPWLQFLQSLYNRTGGSIPETPGDTTIQNVLLSSGSDDSASLSHSDDRSLIGILSSSGADMARADRTTASVIISPEQSSPVVNKAVKDAYLLSRAFSDMATGDIARSYKTKTITVGASPFFYTAPSTGFVISTGGTTVQLFYFRDPSAGLAVGFTQGIIPVRKKDIIGVNYATAPTMTFVPM